MGGLFRWIVSFVLHDRMLIPSSCGMLVYRLVTSIDTSIVPFTTFVFASSKWRSPVQSGESPVQSGVRQFKVANRQFKVTIASSKWR